jgi:short-subunit dehydrogenase
VLVNSAGATKMMPLAETTADGIAGLFDLTGQVLTIDGGLELV